MSYPISPGDVSGLKDKSVIITGGSSGLGLATAKSFAEAGAYVTIADVQNADATVSESTAKGLHLKHVHCDITNWQSQLEAFKEAIRFSPTGRIHSVAAFAAVDNAGHMIDQVNNCAASLEEDPSPPSTASIDINLTGSFYTAYLALHYFRLSPKDEVKSLTLVSSLAGYIDDTHNTSYTTSKFGLRGVFRAIRERASREMGVRCNLIAPWAIKTPMTEPLLAAMKQFGIEEGKGMTMATTETLVGAVGRCTVDSTLSGRAIAIMPEGAFDICDDITGGYGGDELRRLMEKRKADGDFLQG